MNEGFNCGCLVLEVSGKVRLLENDKETGKNKTKRNKN